MQRKPIYVLFTILTILLLSACSNQQTVSSVTASGTPHLASAKGTAPSTTAFGQLQVHYIDVGQGDSIYIRTAKGDDILIDGGNNQKGSTVVSYLKRHGVTKLDVMILSHPDSDHIGGLNTVIQDIPVKSVYAPKIGHNTVTFEHLLQAIKNKGLKIQTAQAGVVLPLQDMNVQAKFLAPVKAYPTSDTNDWSDVLDIQYGSKNFLFTGDAEVPSENDMMAQHLLPHVDVLKVSHHGSDTASSMAFLNTIKPEYAILSVGLHNRYGHPKPTVLDRLNTIHAKIYRTDKQGSIVVSSNGTTIQVQTER